MTVGIQQFTSLLFISLDESSNLSQVISNTNIFVTALEQICNMFPLERMMINDELKHCSDGMHLSVDF